MTAPEPAVPSLGRIAQAGLLIGSLRSPWSPVFIRPVKPHEVQVTSLVE